MTPVTLTLDCGGCDASAPAKGPLRRRFHHSRYVGCGVWQIEDPRDLTPEGWVMFDPYTSCTYCPECWASIEAAAKGDRTMA